jgi:protocatechuate 3,4-dioxygenase beta subunit
MTTRQPDPSPAGATSGDVTRPDAGLPPPVAGTATSPPPDGPPPAPQAPHPVEDEPRRAGRRWWSAAAIVAGAAYLTWRATATLDGVPTWLAWPALVVEALGVLGVSVLLVTLGRTPVRTLGRAHATADADVVLRVESEPIGRIVASLAGLRHTARVASVTILTSTDREDVLQLAELHGIETCRVDPEADSTGLRAAIPLGRSPFLVVLDAGDVPMPDMVEVLVRHAHDGHVAGVRGAVDSWSADSAEHDARGRHQLRFEREVLYPAAGRAAVLEGSGVLLRRWAVEHVGVPPGPRRTVELRLSMRLNAAGLEVVAPAEPVLVSTHASNTASAVALERRRSTAAALRMLGSSDGPLLARGLGARDRVALLATMVRPLSGLRRAAFLAVLVVALVAGELPFRATAAGLVGFWLPWVTLQAVALRVASAGRLTWGDRARWSLSTMGAAVAALRGPGDPVIGAGRMQPRRGAFQEFTSDRALAVTFAVMAVVVPLVAVSDRFTGWLLPMPTAERAALLAVTVWVIVVMLDVLRCLNGALQLRRAPRVTTELPGAVAGAGATIIDLTPYGAGAVTDEPLAVDQPVAVAFDVPGADQRVPIVAEGVVRSVRTTALGTVSGIEFVSMDHASSDALYEFCEVLHSHEHFAAQRRTRAEQRAAPIVPRVTVPPRRIGVRLAAIVVLLGVCVAVAPSLARSEAPPADGGAGVYGDGGASVAPAEGGATGPIGAAIGDTVWEDRDNDGRRGPDEPGIAGVSVRVAPDVDGNGLPDGPAVAGTVSAADGSYLVDGLEAGTYVVEVLTPAGHRSSTGTNGSPSGPVESIAVPDPDLDPTDGADHGVAIDASGAVVRSLPVSLAAGRRAMAVDFGFWRPMSIGNLVWEDVDDSGTRDTGEPGVPGVVVALRQGEQVIAVTVTDPDGHYLFTHLAPGSYELEVTAPDGSWSSSGGDADNPSEPAPDPDLDTDDDDDNGSTAFGAVRSATVVLVPGAEPTADDDTAPSGVTDPAADDHADATVDFGLWRPLSVGDRVWNDLDDDGVLEAGEPGLPGITVRLLAADGVTEVEVGPDGALGTGDDVAGGVVTDADGRYRFTGLQPGTYRAQVVVPEGWRTSAVADTGDANDDTDRDSNAAAAAVGAVLTGHVELAVDTEPAGDGDTDRSTNLTVDVGLFRPQPAISIETAVEGCDADAATGSSGPAGGCPPGDGTANPVVPAGSDVGWTHRVANTGNVALTGVRVSDDDAHVIDCNGTAPGDGQPFALEVGTSRTCVATGTAPAGPMSVTGRVDAEGETAPGAVGPLAPVSDPAHLFGAVPGLTIETYTLTSDPGPLVAGVLAGPPPAVTATDDADVAGGIDMTANHVVADGSPVWWAFALGTTGDAALTDVAVVDGSGGVVCSGLTVAPGDTVWCVLGGRIERALTASGQYVTVGTATGVDASSDPSRPAEVGPVSDPSHLFVPAPSVEIRTTIDDQSAAGSGVPVAVDAGAGAVWRHVVTNTGDWPLSAVVVVDDQHGAVSCPVLAGSGLLLPGASVTCTVSGAAALPFAGSAGADLVTVATVSATPWPPSSGTLAPPSDDDVSASRTLVASVGDRVWHDADADGVQDDGEEGIAGVTVRLLDTADVVVATTDTGRDGRFAFSGLDPGTYVLEVLVPPGHVVTARDAGGVVGDDALDSDVDPRTRRTLPVRVGGAEADLTVDVGLVASASLGGEVWFDTDADGGRDPGEGAVVGVPVRLFTAAGSAVATAPTDAAGSYRFADLRPGLYVVQFEAPAGAVLTTPRTDDGTGTGPGVDVRTGQTGVIVLLAGQEVLDRDAAVARAGTSSAAAPGDAPPTTPAATSPAPGRAQPQEQVPTASQPPAGPDAAPAPTANGAGAVSPPVAAADLLGLLVGAASLALMALVAVRARRPRLL